MELYDTEEQQVEVIKAWWKEKGKSVILGAVIGLSSLFGWRYYQDSVTAAQGSASESYTKAVQQLADNNTEGEDALQAFIDANNDIL